MSKRIACGLVVATALVSAAPPEKPRVLLQIKPGLWEFDESTKVAGDSVFPDAMLAGVPAAQQARRLAQLRQMIAQPGRERECITQAVFEQRLFGIEAGCKRTVVSNTSGRIEIASECHGESGGLTQDKKAKILATSPTVATMSFHAVSTQNGKTMTVDSVQNGRWVSSSCGNVHGIQIVE
jgi:hypothetical protein